LGTKAIGAIFTYSFNAGRNAIFGLLKKKVEAKEALDTNSDPAIIKMF